MQVIDDGTPLYCVDQDRNAGDVKAQGVGGFRAATLENGTRASPTKSAGGYERPCGRTTPWSPFSVEDGNDTGGDRDMRRTAGTSFTTVRERWHALWVPQRWKRERKQ
jgi:predicted lipoprotein with Yx(FWY)xxD motif